jgi:hypothetical protein
MTIGPVDCEPDALILELAGEGVLLLRQVPCIKPKFNDNIDDFP